MNRLSRAAVLRILAPDQPPVDHPLDQPKVTLGASPRCTVRLARPGVQPLHCVFNCDAHAVTVTSWAAGVRHNGAELRSAELRAGDVLQLADVTVTALDEAGALTDPQPFTPAWTGPTMRNDSARRDDAPATQPAAPGAPSRDATQQARRAFCDKTIYNLAAANQLARGRCRELIAGLRSSREDRSELAGEVADLAQRLGESCRRQQQQQQALERLQNEAAEAAARSVAAEEAEELALQLTAAQQQLDEAKAELTGRTETCLGLEIELARLHLERDEIAARLEADSDQQAELNETLAEREQQLGVVSDQLSSAQTALAEAEQAHAGQAAEAAQLQQQLEEQLDQVHRERDELTTHNQALEARLAELASVEGVGQELQQRIGYLDGELAAAHDTARQREEELRQLRTQLDEARNERDRVETELAEHRIQVEQLTAAAQEAASSTESAHAEELQQAQARCEELAAEVERLTQQLEEGAVQREQTLAELDQLREAQNSWQFEREGLQAEIEQQCGQVAELTNQLNAAPAVDPEQFEAVVAERDRLVEQTARADHEIADMREHCEKLESELDDLRTTVAATEVGASPASQNDEPQAAVVARVEELEAELAASREQLAIAEQRSNELQADYDRTAADLETAREALVAVEAQLTSAESTIPSPETESAHEASAESSDEAFATPPSLEATDDRGVDAAETPDRNQLDDGQDAQQALERLREMAIWDDSDASEAERDADPADELACDSREETSGQVESTPTPAPSFIDQYKHLLPDEEDPVEAPQSAAAVDPPAALANDDDSAALESYMSQMMERMRGGAPAPAPAVPMPGQHGASQPAEDEPKTLLLAPQEPIEPIDLEQLRKTSSKPPLASDLGALRELANKSARKAIATSRKRRRFEIALSKLLLCLIGTASGVFVTMTAKSYSSVFFVGGCLAGFAGLYAGVQLLGVLLQAIRDGGFNGEHEEPGVAEEANAAEQLPIDGVAEASSDAE